MKVHVGDTLKLKKESGPLKTIGSICIIDSIKDDGTIGIKSYDIPRFAYVYVSEDELDEYFDISYQVEPSFDENKNDLGEIVQGFRKQLEKLDEVVTEVLRKTITTVPLRILSIGDIFTYKTNKYIVVRRFDNCSKIAVCPLKSINNIINSMTLCDEDILVETQNDQK